MSKLRNVFKYTFLSLTIVTTSFIVYQSALDSEKSSKWSERVSEIISTILNDNLGMKEDVKTIPPESISLSLTNYKYNHIDGYLDNQIPLGCTKQLGTTILPNNTSNKSVKFSAFPSDYVNLSQSGSNVAIEGLKCGNVTITSTSVVDNYKIAEYNFEIVDLIAPKTFELSTDTIEIKQGLSTYVDIKAGDTNLGDDVLLTSRYFDNKKLHYESSNSDVAFIDNNGYVIGKSVGTSLISISNGDITRQINVTVTENNDIIKYPTNISISGSDTVYVFDMDYDRSEPGQHSTPLSIDWGDNVPSDTNVIWSVDKPLVARVDSNGAVRGYRNTSSDDVEFTVTATSVMDPSLSTSFEMYCRQVLPTSMEVTTKTALDGDGTYHVYNGKSISFSVSFGPTNVTKKSYSVTSSNKEIVNPVGSGSSLTIYGLGDGVCDITVTSTDNPKLTFSFKVTSETRPYVNDGNRNDFTTFLRKYAAGHAALFLLDAIFLTLFIFLAFSDAKKIWLRYVPLFSSPLLLFGLANLSEFIQKFVPGRGSSWNDVLIDMGGVWIGLIVSMIIIMIISIITFIRKKSPNNR